MRPLFIAVAVWGFIALMGIVAAWHVGTYWDLHNRRAACVYAGMSRDECKRRLP